MGKAIELLIISLAIGMVLSLGSLFIVKHTVEYGPPPCGGIHPELANCISINDRYITEKGWPFAYVGSEQFSPTSISKAQPFGTVSMLKDIGFYTLISLAGIFYINMLHPKFRRAQQKH